jgi:hypothetical protein
VRPCAGYFDWRHAVTFDRQYSDYDRNFAEELLVEWGWERGLAPVMYRKGSMVISEEGDYKLGCGYCMCFVGEKSAPRHETRLSGAGASGKEMISGKEELYQPR